MFRARFATALMILAVALAAGCGEEAGEEEIWTTAPPTTTEAVTSEATGGPAETTTTGATTPTALLYAVDTAEFMPDSFGGSGEPRGSGCDVAGDVLPDGVWFGFAQAVSEETITFDLACYFDGEAAQAAAAVDGTEALDEYIRNRDLRVFGVPIAVTAEVYYVDAAGPTWFPELTALSSWPSATSYLPCPSETCAVWLYVNGGSATAIVEQYLP